MPHASHEVLRLVAEIERFCAEAPRQSVEELGADLIELRRGMNVLELKFSRMSAEFAATDQYDVEGCLSPIHWIRVNCHMTSGAAADRVAVGDHVSNVPASAEAMAAGEIGFPHLALIAREASAVAESRATTTFDETRLLNKARAFTVGRFRNFCHHERHANDPAGYAADQAEAVQARTLSLTTGEGGMLWIRGVLDPEGGAVVRTALEPLTKHNGRGDDRNRDRRLADGLVELASHWLDGGSGRSARPHLQVTTTLETLVQRCGAPAGDLELSLPISAAAVERLSCDCSVTRVLLNADSLVIDVGPTTRKIPPATGRALRVRDKGCRWPGCERPASWTSAHHLKHWARGGPTDQGNLVLLCHRHHWMVHEGKWQIVMSEKGDVLTLPPQLDAFTNLARGPGVDSAA
jgi:Domain of unknown function (DUF222)/HNH endonuclease